MWTVRTTSGPGLGSEGKTQATRTGKQRYPRAMGRLGERIGRVQPGKPREIGVAGAELGAALDGHRCYVRVSSQVAGSAGFLEQRAQDQPMLRAGPQQHDNRLRDP